MDEQHGPNQKLKWMSNMDQPKPTIDEQHGPNQKLQWMSNMDPTKNYNG
jgi:hypothetical protein